jgi:hypothetical protein
VRELPAARRQDAQAGAGAAPTLATHNDVYIQQVDDGLGGADVWDEILSAPTRNDPMTVDRPARG